MSWRLTLKETISEASNHFVQIMCVGECVVNQIQRCFFCQNYRLTKNCTDRSFTHARPSHFLHTKVEMCRFVAPAIQNHNRLLPLLASWHCEIRSAGDTDLLHCVLQGTGDGWCMVNDNNQSLPPFLRGMTSEATRAAMAVTEIMQASTVQCFHRMINYFKLFATKSFAATQRLPRCFDGIKCSAADKRASVKTLFAFPVSQWQKVTLINSAWFSFSVQAEACEAIICMCVQYSYRFSQESKATSTIINDKIICVWRHALHSHVAVGARLSWFWTLGRSRGPHISLCSVLFGGSKNWVQERRLIRATKGLLVCGFRKNLGFQVYTTVRIKTIEQRLLVQGLVVFKLKGTFLQHIQCEGKRCPNDTSLFAYFVCSWHQLKFWKWNLEILEVGLRSSPFILNPVSPAVFLLSSGQRKNFCFWSTRHEPLRMLAVVFMFQLLQLQATSLHFQCPELQTSNADHLDPFAVESKRTENFAHGSSQKFSQSWMFQQLNFNPGTCSPKCVVPEPEKRRLTIEGWAGSVTEENHREITEKSSLSKCKMGYWQRLLLCGIAEFTLCSKELSRCSEFIPLVVGSLHERRSRLMGGRGSSGRSIFRCHFFI